MAITSGTMMWLLSVAFTNCCLQKSTDAVTNLPKTSDQSQASSKLIINSKTSKQIQQKLLPPSPHVWTEERVDHSFSEGFLIPAHFREGENNASGDGDKVLNGKGQKEGTEPSVVTLATNGKDMKAGADNTSLPLPRSSYTKMQRLKDDAHSNIANIESQHSLGTDSTPNVVLSQISVHANEGHDSIFKVTKTPSEEKVTRSTTGGFSDDRFTDSVITMSITTLSLPSYIMSLSPTKPSILKKSTDPLIKDEVHKVTEEMFTEPSLIAVEEVFHLPDLSTIIRSSPELPGVKKSPAQIPQTGDRERGGHCRGVVEPIIERGNTNGTLLLWEDLSRTLAFAWELHVFGSAGLFLLLAVGAIWGVIAAVDLLHPLCEALTFANILLLLTGVSRAIHFFIDPYGTRQILERPVLAMLYNLPFSLLIWTQAALALLILRGERLMLLPSTLQHPSTTASLAGLHCSSLAAADLLTKALSPALPLMLHTLSICWSLALCVGILFKTLTPLLTTSVPLWGLCRRAEEQARRVLACCAVLGVLCCGLQIYALLWFHGLLGDWRCFGWGWWLCQFWARLMELAWGFFMLLLGSAVFWMPRGGWRSGKANQGEAMGTERERSALHWAGVSLNLLVSPWRKSEANWAKLMPNNWAEHQQARANMKGSVIQNNQTATCLQGVEDLECNNARGRATMRRRSDLQTVSLWSPGIDCKERESILSLVEFHLSPPSPIDHSWGIDSALHHDHPLGVGSIFTPPVPTCSQNEGTAAQAEGKENPPTAPAHIAYRWALDAASSPAPPHKLRTAADTLRLCPQAPPPPQILQELQQIWERNSTIPRIKNDDDRTSVGDDITKL